MLRRIGRLGDGWFPQLEPDERYRATFDKLAAYAREAGRDPSNIEIEARVSVRNRPIEECVKEAQRWKEMGASYLAINTMNAGLASPTAHIEAIRKFKAATVGV